MGPDLNARIDKYPRTPHLEGSGIQSGDSKVTVRFRELAGRHVVAEEKLDGGNSGIGFDSGFNLFAQSRGHLLDLSGRGGRELQFNALKDWLPSIEAELLDRIEDRYTVYGEWTAVTHTVFYDALPHHFHEFDVLERATGRFLSTARRRELLDGLPICSVPVLWEGTGLDAELARGLIRPSLYKSPEWRENMVRAIEREGLDPELMARHVEDTDLSEGLYVKTEDDDYVTGRFKFVRGDFVQTIVDNDTHVQRRPVFFNTLGPGRTLYGYERPPLDGAASPRPR